MKVWKNGKVAILEAVSKSPKTWTDIRKEVQLSRPVVSDHLKSMLTDGLIELLPSPSKRGAKYDITPKGRDLLLREEDNRFNDQAALFRAYELATYVPKVPTSETLRIEDVPVEFPVEFPEEFLKDHFSTFPLPIRAVLKMSENATYAIEPWLERMRGKWGVYFEKEIVENGGTKKRVIQKDQEIEEELYEEMAYQFANSTIEKLCQTLFERTRVLCSLHSMGEKGSLPTLDNILNFNFEFLCRYEGETILKSASREERTKAKHVLAAILLLYLGGSGKGPLEDFVWRKEGLQSLVESGLLTKEEIQPLLEACKPFRRGLRYADLTDEQKKKMTGSLAQKHLTDEEKMQMNSSRLHYPLLTDLTDEQKMKTQYDYPFGSENLSDEQKRKITRFACKRFNLAGQQPAKAKQVSS